MVQPARRQNARQTDSHSKSTNTCPMSKTSNFMVSSQTGAHCDMIAGVSVDDDDRRAAAAAATTSAAQLDAMLGEAVDDQLPVGRGVERLVGCQEGVEQIFEGRLVRGQKRQCRQSHTPELLESGFDSVSGDELYHQVCHGAADDFRIFVRLAGKRRLLRVLLLANAFRRRRISAYATLDANDVGDGEVDAQLLAVLGFEPPDHEQRAEHVADGFVNGIAFVACEIVSRHLQVDDVMPIFMQRNADVIGNVALEPAEAAATAGADANLPVDLVEAGIVLRSGVLDARG